MTHRSRYIFRLSLIVFLLTRLFSIAESAVEVPTERLYLSGHGPKDAVPWEFSITGGRRAGEQTTILVPSNWEQQGFGSYNYGEEPTPKSAEHGLYRLHFTAPETWKGKRIRLVFEGVMTDATVKLNGHVAGPTHQGAFYRFHYDITNLINLGPTAENLLEVEVAKVSANVDTETAERGGDYWVFGGIFRPVWLECAPLQSIENTAVDARADGSFTALVTLAAVRDASELEAQVYNADGQPVGPAFFRRIAAGGEGRVQLKAQFATPKLWTAETPNLYTVRYTLRKGGEVLHTVQERFGFRTFEVRAGQGLFLNGQRILLKGVDRHSFRPETARTLSREDCYEDARLIRSMNMNAVRMSHYPPDVDFLEACDELGLYVLDELSGWHHAHDTTVGRQLVRAMVERDVNHPCILFWDNGNEGGWNRELDGDFALYDPQQRRVLHPWEIHDDVDTKHYPTYEDLSKRLRGPNILMPTEFLHGLYDGGGGAGLADYWNAMMTSPFGGGGFIWVFADEGIMRTDQGGRVDVYSTYAPDGLVGPHHEKEGSYYTVRELWSPVQITPPVLDENFSGELAVSNRYDFTPLAQCHITWRLVHFRTAMEIETKSVVLAEGNATPIGQVPPHTSGQLSLRLPPTWQEADALTLEVHGPDHETLWAWTWPTSALAKRASGFASRVSQQIPSVELAGGAVRLVSGDVAVTFDAQTGLLREARRGPKTIAIGNGPRLVYARPAHPDTVNWIAFPTVDATTQTRRLGTPQLANALQIDLDYTKTTAWAAFKLEVSSDEQTWKTIYNGSRRDGDGKIFPFPPQSILAVRLSNLHRSDGESISVKSVRLGYDASRFPAVDTISPNISHGTTRDAQTGEVVAWFETRGSAGLDDSKWTLRGDGSLRLDYSYSVTGDFFYHGITFSLPEENLLSLRWLGEGPFRTWQNRRSGAWLGVHEIVHNNIQAGESWDYPEFQGYFGGLRWARLETTSGPLIVTSTSPETFLRVGTPRINHQNTTAEFPAGDLSFLHAIPAMGSKFISPEKTGPTSQPSKAEGIYRGSLVFTFGPQPGAN